MAGSRVREAGLLYKGAARTYTKEGPAALARKTVGGVPGLLRDMVNGRAAMHRFLSSPFFQITEDDIARSQLSGRGSKSAAESMTWFLPDVRNVLAGGAYTILRCASDLAEHGVRPTIVFYEGQTVPGLVDQIRTHFPPLSDGTFLVPNWGRGSIEDLPPADIAFATFWPSAYVLLKFNQTLRKYYFIQDYEPMFYEGGSMSALAESTYRFGFHGIFNTPGLGRAVEATHNMKGVSFVPAIDGRYFYPPDKKPTDPLRIFFYSRPGKARNGFELGLLAIATLLDTYGDRIEVVTAGAEWNEWRYGLGGRITNLGLLRSLEEVGDLYRSCDIGFVFMMSKHPSYQPFEYMACGMATVSNRNPDNTWFLRDGENCLLAEPSPAAMAGQIGRLIEDSDLRRRIAGAGASSVTYEWGEQLDKIRRYVEQDITTGKSSSL
jgi:glycosyltransferase involved in cell wall biosynthesis